MSSDREENAYDEEFHDACTNGDLLKVQEALASGELSTETLDEGLCYATEKAHPDIVAALLDAGVRITPDTVDYLVSLLCFLSLPRTEIYLLTPTYRTTTYPVHLLAMKLVWLLLVWLSLGEAYAGNKCGPETADAFSSRSDSKRSVGFLRLERNVTRTEETTMALAKRMRLPKKSLGLFYKMEMPRLSKKIVMHDTAKRATDMSAAIMKRFAWQSEEWSTGIEGLKGCTSLYIISRKGVYGTHWWENISFDPDKEWKGTRSDEKMFELTVTDMLKYGGRYHARLDAEKIEDDHIRAYLIRPKKVYRQLKHEDDGKDPDKEPADYSEQWNQIRITVGELVPKLSDPARWEDFEYDVVKMDS